MAGESPDRSEQKQSSGQTAPEGNAPLPADVPEARADRPAPDRTTPGASDDTGERPATGASDAPGSSDEGASADARPGLEQRKPASGRSGTGPRGPRAGADVKDGAAKDGARASAVTADPERPAAGGDRDVRLRAAVAAWVSGEGEGDEGAGGAVGGQAGGDQQPASGAPASPDGAEAGTSATEGRTGPTAAARAKGAAALAQAAKGRAKAARDQSAADGRTGQAAPTADPGGGTDAAGAAEGQAESGRPDDRRADSKKTDEKRADSRKTEGKRADGKATAVFGLPATEGADGVKGTAATTNGGATADGDSTTKVDDARDTAESDNGRTPPAAKDAKGGGDGGGGEDRATAVFKLPAADGTKGAAPAKDTDTTVLAGANDAGERSAAKGAGAAKGDSAAKGGKGSQRGPGPRLGAGPGAGTDAAKGAGAAAPVPEKKQAEGAGVAASDGEAAVDHPTTMFKAVTKPEGGKKSGGGSGAAGGTKPKRTATSDAASTAGTAGAAAAGEKAAETDSERTSRFVALRSTDVPTAKPVPAMPTTPPPPRGPATEPTDTSAAPTTGTAGSGTADAEKTAMIGALPETERTKQQPLPPLDLLAKLTNTPPPPQTPLRTAVRRFKIWTPLVILLAIIFVVVQAVRPLPAPALTLGGTTAYTFKGDYSAPWPGKGQGAAKVVGVGSLGDFGPQKPVPTASVAKVMTAYVVLKDHPLKANAQGQQITVDAEAEQQSQAADESRVPLKQGRQYSERQMLELLMIPSGNNVARLLARWDAGSESAFVKKMSAEAKKLGMNHTTYTDPSGLTQTTKSTAVDQLKLAEQVMKDETFRQVVTMENVKVDGIPEQYANNKLLTYEPNIVRGIKTGSSTPAGGAFMWAAYKGVAGKDRLIVGVLMDQRAPNSNPNADLEVALNNSRRIIDDVRSHLTSAKVVHKGQVVGYVDDGLGGQTPVVATKDLTAAGWPGMKVDFSLDGQGKTIPHEAKAGTRVGVLTAGAGASAVRIPVVLQKDMAKPGFGAKLVRLG